MALRKTSTCTIFLLWFLHTIFSPSPHPIPSSHGPVSLHSSILLLSSVQTLDTLLRAELLWDEMIYNILNISLVYKHHTTLFSTFCICGFFFLLTFFLTFCFFLERERERERNALLNYTKVCVLLFTFGFIYLSQVSDDPNNVWEK